METERVKTRMVPMADLERGDVFRMSDDAPWETVEGWSESANGILYLYTNENTRGWRGAPTIHLRVHLKETSE